jgi:hypothetical protein
MYIEFAKSVTEPCHCCGGASTRLYRFVHRDSTGFDMFAAYQALFSDKHPSKEVHLAVGLGEWEDSASPDERRAFALVLTLTDSIYESRFVDADESPWKNSKVLGRMLNRDEALAHVWKKEIFDLVDHIVETDLEIRSFLVGKSST